MESISVPPLPRLDDKLGQLMRGPTEWCNWVIPGMLLVGSYPGAFEDRKNDQLLRRILRAGVDEFVCLQGELDNDIPEEVWRSGTGLRPYFEDAKRLSKRQLNWRQLPVADGDIAPDDATAEFVVDLAEDLMAGRVIYMHCWGGHGRAGVMASLMLSYIYRLTAADCLKRVQAYHDCRLEHQGAKSPQTVVQRDQVKRQVVQLLACHAPTIKIVQEARGLDCDATKRGAMKPLAKSAQTASCPALKGADNDTPTGQRKINLKTSVHEHAMPDYLELQPLAGSSAKRRRDAALRQKSAAAALRRMPFEKPKRGAGDVLYDDHQFAADNDVKLGDVMSRLVDRSKVDGWRAPMLR